MISSQRATHHIAMTNAAWPPKGDGGLQGCILQERIEWCGDQRTKPRMEQNTNEHIAG